MSLRGQAEVSPQPGKAWGRWIGLAVLLLVLLVPGVRLLARAVYPADVGKNPEAYRRLVRLKLTRCGGDDYMAGVGDVGLEMESLMRRLGLDRVHCYPGNDQHPGSVVYLERQVVGPITTMIVYSVSGEPRSITDCYTSRHMKGKWYRSHSLLCLP
ncbi:MAG: hypothetical protein U9R72_10840 [Chloroflexota bacterium]|nr:hypothetical protein [Chloroflexota bacterium]